MKKLIVMTFLSLGLGTFAQQKGVRNAKNQNLTMEQRQEKILQKMQKDLVLTPDQVLKMKDLMSKNQKEIANQRETRKSLAQEKMAKRKSEMGKILTPEQFKKWETEIGERKEKMVERKAERKSKL